MPPTKNDDTTPQGVFGKNGAGSDLPVVAANGTPTNDVFGKSSVPPVPQPTAPPVPQPPPSQQPQAQPPPAQVKPGENQSNTQIAGVDVIRNPNSQSTGGSAPTLQRWKCGNCGTLIEAFEQVEKCPKCGASSDQFVDAD